MEMRTSSIGRLKVLVVDPAETEQSMISSVLAEHNCDIAVARDVEGGLNMVGRWQPDVIIVDHGIRLDGVELCRRLRQAPKFAEIPVVMMSSMPQSDRTAMVGLFESGCDQVVIKPFKPQTLCSALQSALSRAETGVLIPVMHRTGEIALVCPRRLDQLIDGKKILCFRRRDRVAVVDRDRVRTASDLDYCGPERRRHQ